MGDKFLGIHFKCTECKQKQSESFNERCSDCKNKRCLSCNTKTIKVKRIKGQYLGQLQFGVSQQVCINPNCFRYININNQNNWINV